MVLRQILIHYPVLPHIIEDYQDLNKLSFPNAERMQDDLRNVSIITVMTDDEVRCLTNFINEFKALHNNCHKRGRVKC